MLERYKMSAHDQMRAMLDQLMGTARNGEVNPKIKYYDPKVCKSFLLGCCPHDILASTRMDIGECPKHHDLALRADYEQAAKNKDHYYDIDAMEHLQSFINDCDRRTEVAKKRLAETQEELSAEVAAKANKVHELAEQIGKNLAKAEELGAEGHVEESMKLMEEVEEIRKKKAQAEQDYRNSMPASSYQQQKLRVCEVCSAYLGIHDNDRRLADHFGGKLHLGFIKIREKLEELRITVEERREKRRIEREKERELAEKEREKTRLFEDRERERLRSRAKDEYSKRRRSSSRERTSSSRKERSHSRSSSKSHKHRRKSRSRSKSRRSRSKSHDRKRSYRSRSRDRHQRDKYKEEKHKHRSHKRKHECENGETKKEHHRGSTDGHLSQEDSAKEEGEWSHMESGEN